MTTTELLKTGRRAVATGIRAGRSVEHPAQRIKPTIGLNHSSFRELAIIATLFSGRQDATRYVRPGGPTLLLP